MSSPSGRRIIGETPKGKVANATIPPSWAGECVLHYTVNGAVGAVRLPGYAVARTAAIRAIFSESISFQGVVVSQALSHESSLPLFHNAEAWLQAEMGKSALAIKAS